MTRRPSNDVITRRLNEARNDLINEIDRIIKLMPAMRDQRLREKLPDAISAECRYDKNHMRVLPAPTEEPLDTDALVYLLDTIRRLQTARVLLSKRIPARDEQLNNKRCLVCNTVHGRMKHGLCATHYKAWQRVGYPDLTTWIKQTRDRMSEAWWAEHLDKRNAA